MNTDDPTPGILERIRYANDNGEALWERQILPRRGRGFTAHAIAAWVNIDPSTWELCIGATSHTHGTGLGRERQAAVYLQVGPLVVGLQYRGEAGAR